MASIGGLSFWTLEGGYPELASQTPQEITRPGVDGIAYRQGPKQAGRFTLRGRADVLTANAVATTVNSYVALVGSVVTVNIRNVNYSLCMVEDVQPVSVKQTPALIGGLTGNGARYIIESQWTLRYIGTAQS